MVDLLRRPVYGMAQVDRLLGTRAGTARRWIDGYERGGRRYDPVIRLAHTGSELVTWGEFVEARLLAHYRDKGVPLIRMRPVIERLRKELKVEHPLAMADLWAHNRELVEEAQKEEQLARGLRIVVVTRTGQLTWAQETQEFLDEAEWDEPSGPVSRLRPLGPRESVVIDPLRRFGEPAVRSVPTEVIAEHFRVGERPDAIADVFELSLDEVYAALQYEMQLRNVA